MEGQESKELKTSGCFEKIQNYINNNGIVLGRSAGAIIFGKDLEACKLEVCSEIGLENSIGYNLLSDISLLCHYADRNEDKIHNVKNYLKSISNERVVLALQEEITLFLNGSKVEIIGNETHYKFEGGKEIEVLPKDIFLFENK